VRLASLEDMSGWKRPVMNRSVLSSTYASTATPAATMSISPETADNPVGTIPFSRRTLGRSAGRTRHLVTFERGSLRNSASNTHSGSFHRRRSRERADAWIQPGETWQSSASMAHALADDKGLPARVVRPFPGRLSKSHLPPTLRPSNLPARASARMRWVLTPSFRAAFLLDNCSITTIIAIGKQFCQDSSGRETDLKEISSPLFQALA